MKKFLIGMAMVTGMCCMWGMDQKVRAAEMQILPDVLNGRTFIYDELESGEGYGRGHCVYLYGCSGFI
jgi:hypothetical protein